MTKLLHVVRLRFNWKQDGHPDGVTYEMSPLMYVTGPPGAGKTAIVEGLSLPLTGSVPAGFLGRASPTKAPSLLWRAKPKDATALFSEVELSDGRLLRWEQARHNSRPTWTLNGEPINANNPAPAVVMTVDEIRANIVGSAAKTAEKWIATRLHIGVSTVVDELRAGYTVKGGSVVLPSEAALKAIEALAESPVVTTPAALLERLIRLGNEAESEAKAAGRVADALEQTVELVSDADLATAGQAVHDAQGAEAAAVVVGRNVAELQTLAQNLAGALTELREIPVIPPRAALQLRSARATLEALRTTAQAYPGNGLCPTCRESVGPQALAGRSASLADFVERAAPSVQALTRREELGRRIEDSRQRAGVLQTHLGDALYAQVRQGVWEDTTPAVRTALVAARERLATLQAKRVGAAGPTMAVEQRASAEARRDALRAAAQHVEKAQSTLVGAALVDFVKGATALYPSRSFGKPIIKMRPNVVLGINRNGRPGAPSGCQGEALLLACAGSLAEMEAEANGTADGLSLLVFGDVGMDTETTRDLLSLFVAWTGGQVVVPTTADVPTADVPAPWGQIRLTSG